jgi:hypothetical protein
MKNMLTFYKWGFIYIRHSHKFIIPMFVIFEFHCIQDNEDKILKD